MQLTKRWFTLADSQPPQYSGSGDARLIACKLLESGINAGWTKKHGRERPC